MNRISSERICCLLAMLLGSSFQTLAAEPTSEVSPRLAALRSLRRSAAEMPGQLQILETALDARPELHEQLRAEIGRTGWTDRLATLAAKAESLEKRWKADPSAADQVAPLEKDLLQLRAP